MISFRQECDFMRKNLTVKLSALSALLAVSLLFTACGSVDDAESVGDTAYEEISFSAEDELDDETDGEDLENSDADDLEWVRVSENEVQTSNGAFSMNYEYEFDKEENAVNIIVTTTNNTDEDVVADVRPLIEIYTDLTDPDTIFATTADFQRTTIKAHESDVSTYTRSPLEDEWSTATVGVHLYMMLESDLHSQSETDETDDSIEPIEDRPTYFEFTLEA